MARAGPPVIPETAITVKTAKTSGNGRPGSRSLCKKNRMNEGFGWE